MPHHSLPLSFKRRCLFTLLATGFVGSFPISGFGQDGHLLPLSTQTIVPAATDSSNEPMPEHPSSPSDLVTPQEEMTLDAPGNSTLEMRIARRPWLLEKLTKASEPESDKMTPPKPPVELPDPPSLSRLTPRPSSNAPIDIGTDGWQSRSDLRESRLNPVDQQPQLRLVQPRETTRSSEPLSPQPTALPPMSPLRVPATDGPVPLTDPIPLTDPPQAGSRSAQPSALSPTAESVSSKLKPAPSSRKVLQSDQTTATKEDNEGTESVTIRKLVIGRDGAPVNSVPTDDMNRESASGTVTDLPSYAQRADSRRADSRRAEPRRVETSIAPSDAPVKIEDESVQVTKNVDVDYAGYPNVPMRLTSEVQRMQNVMQACLTYYHGKPEVANERSNWGMMHAIMVYGIDTKVIVDNNTYSTIAWIAGNNACRGQRLLAEENGRISVKSGIGLQGHQGQMLAVFSLSDVPATYPLYADGNEYSVNDVIREEQLACKSGEELTFTLIGLSHYLDTDTEWRDSQGQRWDFERLIREELSQPIVGAACGGTHRLMGFAHALRKRRAEGKPIEGQWKRAEKFTEDFVEYAYRLQNRDGSMSTDWFEGREDDDDMDRKVQTTGHMVEWLLTVTPDSQLQNPRLVAAVRYLLTAMYKERSHEWSIGPKGHALRSLAMYYERVYQSGPAWRAPMTARSTIQSRR